MDGRPLETGFDRSFEIGGGQNSFFKSAGITAEGKAAAQASFAIDRTRWNVKYGSGRLFRNLGGHLVNDMIELQLRIVSL